MLTTSVLKASTYTYIVGDTVGTNAGACVGACVSSATCVSAIVCVNVCVRACDVAANDDDVVSSVVAVCRVTAVCVPLPASRVCSASSSTDASSAVATVVLFSSYMSVVVVVDVCKCVCLCVCVCVCACACVCVCCTPVDASCACVCDCSCVFLVCVCCGTCVGAGTVCDNMGGGIGGILLTSSCVACVVVSTSALHANIIDDTTESIKTITHTRICPPMSVIILASDFIFVIVGDDCDMCDMCEPRLLMRDRCIHTLCWVVSYAGLLVMCVNVHRVKTVLYDAVLFFLCRRTLRLDVYGGSTTFTCLHTSCTVSCVLVSLVYKYTVESAEIKMWLLLRRMSQRVCTVLVCVCRLVKRTVNLCIRKCMLLFDRMDCNAKHKPTKQLKREQTCSLACMCSCLYWMSLFFLSQIVVCVSLCPTSTVVCTTKWSGARQPV